MRGNHDTIRFWEFWVGLYTEIENAKPNSIASEIQYSLGVFMLGGKETYQYQISIEGFETADLVIRAEQIEEPLFLYYSDKCIDKWESSSADRGF